MKKNLFFCLLSALFFSTGCEFLINGRSCTDQLVFGINVTATNTLTSAPVDSFYAVARDGAYVDSASAFTFFGPETAYLVPLAPERAGIYHVTVSRDGFSTWEQDRIRVIDDEDGCHVEPVSLEAPLTPIQ